MNKAIVTVVGGGNSTHTIIPILSSQGHAVNLLTRKPDNWSHLVQMQYVLPDGSVKTTLDGKINIISNKAEEVIPKSDVIILSLPVSNYREVLHHIAPYITNSTDVFVGTIYGQGGFNWMVDEIKNKFHLSNINYFAIGLIPWITRTKEYGRIGINYGSKAVNVVALSDNTKYEYLQDCILNDLCYHYFKKGKFLLSSNFLSLSLSVDNQIIHLSRLYSMFLKYSGKWKKQEDVPLFYKDYDDLSAEFLKKLDDDYSLIRNAIVSLYPNIEFEYMLNYLDLERFSYNSVNLDIKESFVNSETLGQIPTPVIENDEKEWVFNVDHRFFKDDLYYGIVIAKWIAEKLGIKVKTIDEIICWAQELLGDKIINNDMLIIKESELIKGFKHGIPIVYGFNSIDDIMG